MILEISADATKEIIKLTTAAMEANQLLTSTPSYTKIMSWVSQPDSTPKLLQTTEAINMLSNHDTLLMTEKLCQLKINSIHLDRISANHLLFLLV